LVVEAVSRRVWPAQSYRQGVVQEEVWLLIERRRQRRDGFELRHYFSTRLRLQEKKQRQQSLGMKKLPRPKTPGKDSFN